MEDKKKNRILIIINVVLIVALIMMTIMYLYERKCLKDNLNNTILQSYDIFEANEKICELEEELEKYKNENNTMINDIE